VFARARENARRASCQSNLKQIGLGMMQYTQDYDEKYPYHVQGFNGGYGSVEIQTDPSMPGYDFTTGTDAPNNDKYKSWMDSIFPYVKSKQIYLCPSGSDLQTYGSYGYSSCISGAYATSFKISVPFAPMALAAVERPAEVMILMDWNYLYNSIANPSTKGYIINYFDRRIFPHLDGGNLAYADGHVKWANRNSIFYTTTSWSDRTWNAYLP
jgi:prepilin-type processing-associated H-X9-DG protein